MAAQPLRRGKDSDEKVSSGRLAPFGQVLGLAAGKTQVPCYSCDYDSAEEQDFQMALPDGTFTGYKWQCVEFARRWLIMNLGVTFSSIPMAYHIFQLDRVYRVSDGKPLPLVSFQNGETADQPQAGDILIWRAGGRKIGRTGHVAIITEASAEWVRIAEQNWDDLFWPQEQNFSRELPCELDSSSNFVIREPYILGWMRVVQVDDPAL